MNSPKIPAKPSKETIYIDIDDEITSIIDKLENAKEKVVALVLPKRSSALQSVVNMKLLKKSADASGKNVVLITAEAALMPLAGAAKIHVAKSLQSKPEIPAGPNVSGGDLKDVKIDDGTGPVSLKDAAEDEEDLPIKINYDQPIGELADGEEEKDIVELEDETGGNTSPSRLSKLPKLSGGPKIKVPNFDKFRVSIGLIILGVVGLVAFMYFATSVLPKATVSIQTTSTPVSANLTLTTSDQAKTVDLAKNIIPATLKTSDQTSTQQVNATGQINSGDKAKGTISFVNCSVDDVVAGTTRTVPAGTGVSANGLTFITQASVTVGPSHFAGSNCKNDVVSDSVAMTAISGGAKFNVDSTTYKVAGLATVSGSGSKTAGGTDSIQTVVAQADLDGAKVSISSASSDTFSKTFLSQLSDQGFYVLASTLKQSDPTTSASPALGQPATTATVTVKITYSVLVIKKDDLKAAVTNALATQIDKTKQKVEDSDLIAGATVTLSNQTSPTVATLNITEDTKAVPVLDVNSIKAQVKGKKKGDIVSSIGSITGVKTVTVRYSPFWVSKVPDNTAKITVVITHVAGTSSGQ